ncbi:MAG: metal-sulfur cluster assembly factor [Thermoleophilia bacterium]
MNEQGVWAALAGVVDPELGLDIVELGLVYEVRLTQEGIVVTMTLTTQGCPLHEVIVEGVKRALTADGRPVGVHVVFDPPWSPERIGAGGLRTLGAPGVDR